jgi:hypothetical protein
MVVRMTPTPKLRFVEREIQEPYEFELHKHISITKRVRILQQWWVGTELSDMSEWRDVPIEKE